MRIDNFGSPYMNNSYQDRQPLLDNRNKDSSLSGLGNLGEIQSSVIQQAVIDMQKDEVLHEYQYFVGSKVISAADQLKDSKVISSDEDGVVLKLN